MAYLADILRVAPSIIEGVEPYVLPAITFVEASYDAPLERQPILGSSAENTRTFQVLSGALDGAQISWGSFSNGNLAFDIQDIFCVKIRYAFEGAEAYKDLSEVVGTDIEQLMIALVKEPSTSWGSQPPTAVDFYSQNIDEYEGFHILTLCFQVTLIQGC